MLLIVWLIAGAIIGGVARLLLPGPDPMGFFATALLGIGGSLVGGTIANLLFRGDLDISPAGFIGSVIGAVLLLLVIRRRSADRAP